jgi:hypothetical protein
LRAHACPRRLLFLAQLIDVETACMTAKAVMEGREPAEGIVLMLGEITGAGR